MTARTARRTESRRELNRRTVNKVAATRNEGGFSRTDWESLDRDVRKRLTEQAQDALARLDDGVGRPGDRELAEVFDRHAQWDAFAWPAPLCVHGNTGDCNGCFLDHDDEMRRADDA